ncbi:dihydrodipicolinate synthase family protein [Schaalia sp. ZJ1691]|uniref:dihydrodipicolinate synthase family protein n=1 Tax=Schaalia sp. ZJ1691 TaxID=2709404 RepID=UPI0013EE2377|nr:dihydrodipicolinate synthase family protein [Schaalia sp. ZJ1691]
MTKPEILSALTTPFHPDGSLDIAGFRRNINVLAPLLDGVFVAGTTGEFHALTVSEHASLVECCLTVFGAERTVVHVGAPSTLQSLELTRQSVSLGAQRFAAITPYYLPASIDGIVRHWGAIREACEGELYGYIFPDVAVTDILPRDLPEVLESGISGIKVSARASARVLEYLNNAPAGFKLWSGNDADIPATIAAGGTGSVSGVSGACPHLWAELSSAMESGDQPAIAAVQERIEQTVAVLGPSIANIKWALDLQGRSGGTCRMSIDPPDAATRDLISSVITLTHS